MNVQVPQNKQAKVVLYQLRRPPSGIHEKADTALGNEVEKMMARRN